MMPITSDQLQEIIKPVNINTGMLNQITNSLNQTFDGYEINTNLRMCHFLAQVLHESGTFRYTEEIWGPTVTQQKYEGRADLGNDSPGDGFKYRGRGWIQLTGKANYKLASAELNQDFVNNPDLLQQYPGAALIAGWYWKNHNLNSLADNDDILDITRKINGGTNGLAERQGWLSRAKAVING
jgi:putative chitinase